MHLTRLYDAYVPLDGRPRFKVRNVGKPDQGITFFHLSFFRSFDRGEENTRNILSEITPLHMWMEAILLFTPIIKLKVSRIV